MRGRPNLAVSHQPADRQSSSLPPPPAAANATSTRLQFGAAPIERVNISRLARSLSVTVLLSATAMTAAAAQDTRTDVPATHVVKRGDTLWDLAKLYLGDSYLWPEIYRLNTDQIQDPHWIYPGETLRLPARTTNTVAAAPNAVVTEPTPVRRSNLTVFAPRTLVFGRASNGRSVTPPRVAIGDVMRAPFYSQVGGPKGAGKIMFGADLPGIDKAHPMTNYSVYDKLLMVPPEGSTAAEGNRFVAYEIGPTEEGMGTMVVPTAMLQVVRSPRDGEPAVVEVRQLYGVLEADAKVIALDTTGAGATATPMPVAAAGARTASLLEVYRPAVLPSLGHYVLFNLSSQDGMKIGDEVEIYRPRAEPKGDDGPTLPEVAIAMGQVVRVTPYGATARVTTQQQPAIRKGESVRVTARMP